MTRSTCCAADTCAYPHLESIHIIANQWVARVGHVHTYLVGAASGWPAAHQAAATALHTHIRVCSGSGTPLGCRGGVAAPPAAAAAMANKRVCNTAAAVRANAAAASNGSACRTASYGALRHHRASRQHLQFIKRVVHRVQTMGA